jgi:acetyltransferase-like isoleucine patch superfamily enzyme
MQNSMFRRPLGFVIYSFFRELALWLVFTLFNWWPENMVTCKIRGFFVGQFFKKCGRNFQIGRNFRIIYPQRMEVGDNVYIAQDSWINAKGGLTLGNAVTIGPRCGLITTFHKKSELGFRHGIGAGGHAPIVIGKGTWLAINAVVRHNITVGCRCVIAANAVVTKDVPDDSVVGGVPAKILKSGHG